MNTLVRLISSLVQGVPSLVVVVALALTGVLAWYAQDVESVTGNEGFAPDNPELEAAEIIGERFGESDEAVVQVLLEVEGGLISRAGLETVSAITAALEESGAAPHLGTGPDRPAVVSPLGPVEAAIAQGAPIDNDEAVRAAFTDAMSATPPSEAVLISGLLPEGTDVAAPDPDQALLIVFVDPPDTGDSTARFDALIDVQTDVADAVASADLPDGAVAEAFAFEMLFADTDSFEAEIARLFAMAFGIILAILAFVYWVRPTSRLPGRRSLRRATADVALTMTTIVMAITWMNGAAALLGPGYGDVIGGLTEVTQILPVLLIGLGVDYGIHLTSRYREELGASSVADSMGGAVRTVGIALALATMTTAVGFLTNVVNPVPALRDFGVLAAVGIAASFLLMLTFVPSVRILLDRRAEASGRLASTELGSTGQRLLPQLMARTAILAQRAPIPTLLITVVLGGGLGVYGLSQLETRFSFTDFVPDDSTLVQTLDTITEEFGGGFGETTQVLIEGDVATADAHNALVAATDELSTLDDVATVDGHAAVSSPATLLGEMLAPGAEEGPTSAELTSAATRAGLRGDLTVPADADVEALYKALGDAAPERAGSVLARDGQGRFELALLAVGTSAGEQGAGELIEGFETALAPLEATGVDTTATSNEIVNEVIVSALSDSQVSSLTITLAAALALLVVTFTIQARRPALGVFAIAPVALVVLWTFGAMAATDIPFGPVTATIAALAIGIGVPYTIHVTNRFREDRQRLPIDDAIESTVRNTGGALAGSAFTTVAGFGVLVTSSLTPFRQFGLVTAYAIGFALLAATLVLPSILVLWDRYHRRRGRESGFVAYRPRHAPPRGSATPVTEGTPAP